MTDFATIEDIRSGLASCCGLGTVQDIYKASITTAVGYTMSLWTAGGAPGAGAAPGAWAMPNASTAGCVMPRISRPLSGNTLRILRADLCASRLDQAIYLADRLGHMGGLSGTSLAAQSVGSSLAAASAAGRCAADGSDVEWWLEWYTATGSSGVNATCAVTYSDNSTGNIVVAVPANMAAFRMLPIRNTTNNLRIKSVNTVTLSATTGTTGSFGVTALARKFGFMSAVTKFNGSGDEVTRDCTAQGWFRADWAALGMPDLEPNSCPFFFILNATATSAGTIVGSIVCGVA